MAVAMATRGLIARALRQQAAVRRAGVAAADAVLARREEAERHLGAAVMREAAFAPGDEAGAVVMAAVGAAWRQEASGWVASAREATRQAGEASDNARAALAETVRREKGFERLVAQQDAEAARRAARRDTLAQLMVLARLPHGTR